MVKSLFIVGIACFFSVLQLIEDHEKGDEFPIDINWASIRLGTPSRGYNDWPHQAAVCFCRLVDVTMIKPEPRAFSRRRSAARVSKPSISKVAAGRHRSSRQVAGVNGPFILLVITEAVHVDAVIPGCQIAKMHYHRVSHFSTDDGTKDSQPFRLRLAMGKSAVGVLDISGLFPMRMEAPRIRNILSVHQFQSTGSVIPIHYFCGNVILTHVASGFLPVLAKSPR